VSKLKLEKYFFALFGGWGRFR